MSGQHPPGPHPSHEPPGAVEDHRVGRVEIELGRVTTRLAALGPARLVRPGVAGVPGIGAEVLAAGGAAPGSTAPGSTTPGTSPPGGATPVELVRPVLQELADVAADARSEPRREVPQLAPHALGDQLVVLVRDVLSLPSAPGTSVRLDAVADRLEALRRRLP